MTQTPRQRYLKRWEALKAERSSWVEHWRELSEHIQPRRSRFLASDRNKGAKKNDRIINSTPRRASRILASGMMAGITSPARPWFRLGTPDPSLSEFGPVRSWLHQVEEALRTQFAKSNIYNALHSAYVDLGTPGTAVLHVDEDDEDALRGYVFPVGQYALANSARLQVDTCYRGLSMTVGQLVERFGEKACSRSVRERYTRGEVDVWVEVLHVIEPNTGREAGKIGPRGMRWRSCWLEVGAADEEGVLREAGYHEFPILAPRWEVTGEDVYGSSPGMDALPDCKQLQQLERRKLTLVDKLASPPTQGPPSTRGRVSMLAGDHTTVDATGADSRVKPIYEPPPAGLLALRDEIRETEGRVNAAYYADLWLAMTQATGGQMTAREVAERHEEKMLQLGPVVERLQDELLDPLIDRAFAILLRRGMLPQPPEELQGADLKVEHISVLAQAQKLIATSSIDRFAGFVGQLAQMDPTVLDKVNLDEAVDTYGDATGVPPDLVRPDDQVQEIRAERAKQQQAQQAGEAAMAAAKGARDLAGASMEGDNALNRLVSAYGGVPPASSVGGGG